MVAGWRGGVDESCRERVHGRVVVGVMLVPVFRAIEIRKG